MGSRQTRRVAVQMGRRRISDRRGECTRLGSRRNAGVEETVGNRMISRFLSQVHRWLEISLTEMEAGDRNGRSR